MELTRSCTVSVPVTTTSADFIVYKGITFKLVFKFKDSANKPLPIAGNIVTFHISDDRGFNILTISSNTTSSNGSQISIIDSANGIADVLITVNDIFNFSFTEAKWWVTLTLPNDQVILRGRGSLYLKEPYEN